MPITDANSRANALREQLPDHAAPYAARLAAIHAELDLVRAAPYAYGRNGPHRRQRDELILQSFAADSFARMVEAEL